VAQPQRRAGQCAWAVEYGENGNRSKSTEPLGRENVVACEALDVLQMLAEWHDPGA